MSLPNEHVVHPTMRLGKRKPNRAKARLKAAEIMTGQMPPVPTTIDHFAKVPEWGLYTNDTFGVCGPTSVANSRRLMTTYIDGEMVAPSLEDVYDLYRRSGNPGFTGDPNNPGDDNGVILQDMLAELVRNGIGGYKALAFAEVDHTSLEALQAAEAVFGFLILGVDLQVAQQAQTNQKLWDYHRSGEWGGHAILGGRYRDHPTDAYDRHGVITWATPVDMTDAFMTNQLDEAWAVIWPDHLRDSAFLAGVNVQALATLFQQLTGRQFVLPPTPAPSPGPVAPPQPQPAPTPPGGGANFQLDQPVLDRVAAAADRSKMSQAEWLNHHLRTYFKIK
jgi:hypothetical protein